MKKSFLALLLVFLLSFTIMGSSYAEDFDYKLSDLNVASSSISLRVEKLSDSSDTATLFVAMYNEYDFIIGLVCVPLDMSQGESQVIAGPYGDTNSGTTVKAFVWSGICTPRSKVLYKTTKIEGGIEFGGEI